MKKLVIFFWDLGIGGIGAQTRELLAELNKRNNVKVYCLFKRKTIEDSFKTSFEKINFLYFSDSVYKGHKLKFFWWSLKNITKIKPTHALGFLNRFGFTLVLAKLWLYLASNHNMKVTVGQPIGTKKYLKQYESFSIWFPLSILIFKIADRIIVPTRANGKEIKNDFFVSEKKIKVVPSYVGFKNIIDNYEKKI